MPSGGLGSDPRRFRLAFLLDTPLSLELGCSERTSTRVYNRLVAALDPGMVFPSLDLQNAHGQPAHLQKRVALYAFFKTTCPTCEFAWPYLERIRQTAKGGKLSVLAVSQDDPEATSKFNEKLGVRVETLYDPAPWKASEAVGMKDVPTLFLVRSDGTIEDVLVGFQKRKMEEFARYAAELAGRKYQGLFRPGEAVPEIKPG